MEPNEQPGAKPTADKFIRDGIVAIFSELAEAFGADEIDHDLTHEQIAGVPMEIFIAENFMLRAWQAYHSREHTTDPIIIPK